MKNFDIISTLPQPTLSTSTEYKWFINNTPVNTLTLSNSVSGCVYNIKVNDTHLQQSNVQNINHIENIEYITDNYTFNINLSNTSLLSSSNENILMFDKNKAIVKSPGICDITYINTQTNESINLTGISCALSNSQFNNFTYTNNFLQYSNNKDFNKCHKVYIKQDHDNKIYIRNPDCWASKYNTDLTCISPWNSNNGIRKAGTAITKRHIINARHYTYPVGTTVRFITNDNQVVDRTISSLYTQSSSQIDLCIYTLNEDLPDTITPCKLLPANYTNYLTVSRKNYIPVLSLDFEEKANIHACTSIAPSNPKPPSVYTDISKPKRLSELNFYEKAIVGDSGNPIFMIINNQLVLITVRYTTGSGSACTYFGNLPDNDPLSLNYMIKQADKKAGIDTGYKVSYFKFD